MRCLQLLSREHFHSVSHFNSCTGSPGQRVRLDLRCIYPSAKSTAHHHSIRPLTLSPLASRAFPSLVVCYNITLPRSRSVCTHYCVFTLQMICSLWVTAKGPSVALAFKLLKLFMFVPAYYQTRPVVPSDIQIVSVRLWLADVDLWAFTCCPVRLSLEANESE